MKREKGLKVSKYHYAKMAPWRQVEAMMHTETGKSAFQNEVYYPKNIEGRKIKGGAFTYMRMDWDKPAPTVTMYNGSISSFGNDSKNSSKSTLLFRQYFETISVSASTRRTLYKYIFLATLFNNFANSSILY